MREILKEHGVTCIYITHKIEEFFRIADTITVLRDGKIITTQPTEELDREKLVSHMVGREMTERFPQGHHTPGDIIFEVKDLHAKDPTADREVIKGASFDLREGEILGIAGVDGNGQVELVEAITGLRKVESGRMVLKGKDITGMSIRQRIKAGMAHIPEDRHKYGLVLDYSLENNIILKC